MDKIIFTDKISKVPLSGIEEINYRDRQKRIFKTKFQDIANLVASTFGLVVGQNSNIFDSDIGATSFFTTNAINGVTINDNNITADGTATDIDINLIPKGEGTINASNLVLPIGAAFNGVQAGFGMSVIARPDDYVANVQSSATIDVASQPRINIQATGTITVTGTPVADETLTVFDQEFAFKAARTGAGEITIDADNSVQATNIAAAITADVAEVTAVDTTNTVLVTAIKTAPFVGDGGNVMVFSEAATGIAVTGAGTLTGGQNADTLGIAGVTYTFIANGITPEIDEIALGASTIETATNIAAIDHNPLVELTTFGTNVIITATAPGTDGDGISYLTDGTRITNSGAPLVTEGGVDEVKSYLTINGIEYVFGVDTGDDPSTDYPNCIPIITSIADTVEDIAMELGTAMKSETTTFSNSSVTINSENIIAKYKDPGIIGNTIEYVNNLIVAGDITDNGLTGGFFTGGVDPDIKPAGQVTTFNGNLYISNGSGWVSYVPLKTKAYQTLTSEQGVFDTDKGLNANITLTNDTVLLFENLANGDEGNIIVTQDANNYTLTLSPTPYVVDDGAGEIQLEDGAGTITILSYTYNGTKLFVNYGINYTNS